MTAARRCVRCHAPYVLYGSRARFCGPCSDWWRSRGYYRAHRARILARMKQYAATHREARRAYLDRNRVRFRDYDHAYNLAHPKRSTIWRWRKTKQRAAA